MELTDLQNRILDGEFGIGKQKALQILKAVGESFYAERFVPVESVHISLSAQGADIWFAEKMADFGAKFEVIPSVNPGYCTCYFDSKSMLSDEARLNMEKTEKAYSRMGAKLTYSCTPYLYDNIPEKDSICALSETSVTIYVNSVLGARTNRESAQTAMCSAITGLTPEYGMLLKENRKASVIVDVRCELKDEFDYSALGLLGKKIGKGVPVFMGLPEKISRESLINLGTMLNVSGSYELFHIPGVTAEAKEYGMDELMADDPLRVVINKDDLDKVKAEWNEENDKKPEFIMLGCPHYTYEQLVRLAELTEDRKLSVPCWCLVSTHVKETAEENGVAFRLKASGIDILDKTCVDEKPVWGFLSGKHGLTDSAKCAYYMGSFGVGFSVKDSLSSIAEMLE